MTFPMFTSTLEIITAAFSFDKQPHDDHNTFHIDSLLSNQHPTFLHKLEYNIQMTLMTLFFYLFFFFLHVIV